MARTPAEGIGRPGLAPPRLRGLSRADYSALGGLGGAGCALRHGERSGGGGERLRSLAEIVGDTGKVVPEENVPALATALQELYADRAECERLGAAGRRRIMDEFSDSAIAAKTLAFWRQISTCKRLTSGNLRANFDPPCPSL